MMDDKDKTVKDTPADKKNMTNTAQLHPPVEDTAVQKTPNRGWDIGAVFWGMLLVAFGGLLLLGNLGVVTVNWSELWRLWPLLIIGAGFSVLATTHWLWRMLSVVFVVAAIFAVIWVGTGQYAVNTTGLTSQNISVGTEQGIARAEVTIRAGASKLNINSDNMSGIVRAKLTSNNLKLDENVSREGDTQKIVLTSDTGRSVWFGPQQNTWDITMTQRIPLKLTIDAGASNISADVSKMQLTDLFVKAGASRSVITLGDKQADLNVNIDSGASSTVVRIPKDSGVAMNFDGGLSSREFEGLTEVSEGEYRSSNYATAANRVTITADAGVASFKIERY